MSSKTIQTICERAVEAIFDRTPRKNFSTSKMFFSGQVGIGWFCLSPVWCCLQGTLDRVSLQTPHDYKNFSMPLIQNLFYRPLLITLKSLRMNLQRQVHKRKIERGGSNCIKIFGKSSFLVVNTTKSRYITGFSPVPTFPPPFVDL